MKLIKVSDEYYKKIEKVVKSKGCTYGQATESLESVIYNNFPHNGNIVELCRCNQCRPKLIAEIKKAGYWPETEVITKIVEVKVPASELKTGPIRHLTYEPEHRHLT